MEMGRGAREETKLCNAQVAQEKKNEKLRKKIKHFLVAQEKRGLKALEKESCHNEKKFDIYSSGGQGLLEEMSIAQLRTELVLVKRWLQKEEDAKRRKIHATKIERQNMLLEKSRVVNHMRHVSRAQWLSKKAAEKHYDKEEINPADQLGL